jgi:HSP20 family molecular chaperone IbpA
MMLPWNKMFPFPKEYMKEDIFKQADVDNWMNKAMKGKLPGTSKMMNSTDFFEQSFDLLKQAQSKKWKKKTSGFEPNVFETHDEVFIRFPVSSEEQLRQIKTYHNTTTCFIENLPASGNKHTITLPCIVKSNTSKARYQNGVVEIKITKETNIPVTKIPIEVIKKHPKK